MSQTCSPSTQRRYGLARVCRVWELARSTVYLDQARRTAPAATPQKRGPKPRWSDAELLERDPGGAGGRALSGRGPSQGVGAVALAGGADLQGARAAADARGAAAGPDARRATRTGRRRTTGRSRRSSPDQMWGMDATSCLTRREGTATVFVVVDHCASECIGLHAAKPGTRFEAVEPLRQGIQALFGGYEGGIAARAAGPARSRQPVRQRLLPRRAEVPGDHVEPGVRAGAGGQRRGRAVHPHAQGATAVGAHVRHGGGAAPGAARVQGALQPRSGSANGTGIRRPRRCARGSWSGPRERSSAGAPTRARAVEALGSILRRGAAISVSPKIPVSRRTQPVTINPVSTKSGAVQPVPT